MPAGQKRRRPWRAWLIAGPCAATVLGGVALVIWGQKTAERLAYDAAVNGPPCPSISRTPSYVRPDSLKRATFQGVQFAHLRGDMDCQTAAAGDLTDDRASYCTFDRPGYLSVTTGASQAAYLEVIGQMVVTRRGHGPWRCTVKPPP